VSLIAGVTLTGGGVAGLAGQGIRPQKRGSCLALQTKTRNRWAVFSPCPPHHGFLLELSHKSRIMRKNLASGKTAGYISHKSIAKV
jgi:hypothetical protein